MSREVLIVLSPLVIAMLGISVWGWVKVPSEARFRGRLGPTGMDFTVGKGTGFVMRLMTGIAIWLGAAVLGARGVSIGMALLLGALSLIVLLIGQVSALRRTG